MTIKTYDVEVHREGRWWMVSIPELYELTQARRVDEIEDMARSAIAVSTGTPLSEVAVTITKVTVDGIDIAHRAAEVVKLRSKAADYEETAQAAAVAYAKNLTAHDVPVRDIAHLLHVSPQRVSQLANPRVRRSRRRQRIA